jgi:hypothetical protein
LLLLVPGSCSVLFTIIGVPWGFGFSPVGSDWVPFVLVVGVWAVGLFLRALGVYLITKIIRGRPISRQELLTAALALGVLVVAWLFLVSVVPNGSDTGLHMPRLYGHVLEAL